MKAHQTQDNTQDKTAALSIMLRAAQAQLFRGTPRVLLPQGDAELVENILYDAPRTQITSYGSPADLRQRRGTYGRGLWVVDGAFLQSAIDVQGFDVVFVLGVEDADLDKTLRHAHASLKEGGLIIAEMPDRHTIRPLAKRAHAWREVEGLERWASARCVEVRGYGEDRQVVVLHHRHEESFAHV